MSKLTKKAIRFRRTDPYYVKALLFQKIVQLIKTSKYFHIYLEDHKICQI